MTDDLDIIATLPPLHPGEVLREDFMLPRKLTAGRIAKACGIPRNRIEMIVREKLGISGDTALRLGRVLGTTADVWMNLQKRYELDTAKVAHGSEIEALEPLAA